MLTTTNIHNVTDVSVTRYNHYVDAIVFCFKCEFGQQETTAFGIKPAAAIKIISALGNPHTVIHYMDQLLNLDRYIEEITVEEVLDKMKGDADAT